MLKLNKVTHNSGFTIVELLVVITIMAILASVSIGGFEYSTKRVAIENDKALVNQINRVIESHAIYEHDQEQISKVLIEEFGKIIEVQSYKFGYDIYCYIDLCEFYLLDQSVYKDNDEYVSISSYLNYTNNNHSQPSFMIKENYHKTTTENKITSSYIKRNNESEYKLVVEMYVIQNDDKTMTYYPHTITLSDLVIINDEYNDVNLNFTITTMSEVKYDYYNYNNEILDNQTITFYYPGIYQLKISDGFITKTIDIEVYNLNYASATLTSTYDIKTPVTTNNQDGSYNLYLPIFFYLNIHDYLTSEQQYIPYDWNNYSTDYRNSLVDSGRLVTEINDQICELTIHNDNHCISIPNLSIGGYTYKIVYYYQGYNGRWVSLTQIFDILIKENGKILISRQ